MRYKLKSTISLYLAVLLLMISYGCSSTEHMTNTGEKSISSVNITSTPWLDLDTVKAGKFDTGRMWTFDYPPLTYFKKAYDFTPSQKWLNNVRMSALRFATYCSASFVSAYGLVMTNDHCARESATEVQKPGEDLVKNGFYAKTLDEERKVPGLFVDQLVLIKDVTAEIDSARAIGKTDEQKQALQQQEVQKLKQSEHEKTGLIMQVVSLFDGGKYSLYGYKRYTDVRLVFVPEEQIAFYGGNSDNFTYPRYDLDCSFFRVYGDDGKPLKTEHHFTWSKNGAMVGQPIFAIGNPGRSDRLLTVSQLKYLRDIVYPRTIGVLKNLINIYNGLIKANPEDKDQLQNSLFDYDNSLKAYKGMLAGLRDPILMQKKVDFENNFKNAVKSEPALYSKYGNLWNQIAENRKQLSKISNKLYAYSLNPYRSSEYFLMAQDMVDLADQLKLPESQRSDSYKGTELDSTIAEIYPNDFNKKLNKEMLVSQIQRFIKYLGKNSNLVQKMTNGREPKAAADYMIGNSMLTSPEKIKSLATQGADKILNSNDPFIYFIVQTEGLRDSLHNEYKRLDDQDDALTQELGKALFEVYGTSIPPDATFTLRISDGVIKGFPYNGTEAPPYTTFYGLYDRYYGFGKKYPWDLPNRWKTPPPGLDLSVPLNFVATNDIIGGNSGSPVINEKAQIVGLAFDGNIQSLPGDFIFDTKENRMVAVHSSGIVEALKHVYKADRLVDELLSGKMDSVSVTSTK